jgi:hypothetical protein
VSPATLLRRARQGARYPRRMAEPATAAPEPVTEVPKAESYPPYITTDAERARWDVSAAIADQLFGDLGPEHAWMATRAIYRDGAPTGDAAAPAG